MVEMGVREQDGVYAFWRDREVLPVPGFQVMLLIKATIYQQPFITSFQQIAGTGDIPGSTQELELYPHSFIIILFCFIMFFTSSRVAYESRIPEFNVIAISTLDTTRPA
jgi:hypothetical protein